MISDIRKKQVSVEAIHTISILVGNSCSMSNGNVVVKCRATMGFISKIQLVPING